MPLSERLLDKLACPRCRGPLEYVEYTEILQCPVCRLSFRIRNDIPVLLLDEAEKTD